MINPFRSLGKFRRSPLEPLEGEYEFRVTAIARPDGAQEPELNQLEVRITPDFLMIRYEHSCEWEVIPWNTLPYPGTAYDEAHKAGYAEGKREAMSKWGLKPQIVAGSK